VLVTGMIHHQVHHQADLAFVHSLQQAVEIGHRAEVFHYVAIVADIVSVVVVGRRIDRIQPDDVDAEAFYIVESGDDPLQVSYPVSVTVLKTPWIDLIDDGFLPPFVIGRCDGFIAGAGHEQQGSEQQ